MQLSTPSGSKSRELVSWCPVPEADQVENSFSRSKASHIRVPGKEVLSKCKMLGKAPFEREMMVAKSTEPTEHNPTSFISKKSLDLKPLRRE